MKNVTQMSAVPLRKFTSNNWRTGEPGGAAGAIHSTAESCSRGAIRRRMRRTRSGSALRITR